MSNAHLPENLSGFDTATGLRMCNGNQTLYLDMLHKFMNSKRHDDTLIRELLAAGEMEAAIRTVHNTKSIAGSLGAMDLFETARQLEMVIASSTECQMNDLLTSYSCALGRTMDALDSAFRQLDPAATVRQTAISEPAERKKELITAADGNDRTILLAEDDRVQMKLTTTILESNGYKVIQAVDGVEAVELFKKHQEQIDLVIMDALMPKMTGKHAWDEIYAIRPDVKACFVSGYTNDIMGGKLAVDFSLPFISKPVMPATLLRTVRDLLDGV